MEHCGGYGPRPQNRNADQAHHEHHLPGVEAEEGVTLRPFGIKVMKITGSGATDAGLEPAWNRPEGSNRSR
jgi:hypothetical protein